MYRGWPILKGLSLCWRCTYRQRSHQTLSRVHPQAYVRQHLRDFTSFFPLKQEAALSQSEYTDSTSYDGSHTLRYEPHDGPIITYEPTDPPTAAQRYARRHSLGLDVLGKPAEILILQHEENKQNRNAFHTEGPDADPKEGPPLSSADLVDAVTKERGIISEEQASRNIDQLRISVLSGNRIQRESIGQSKYDELASKLRDGFTAKQLQAYVDRTTREAKVDSTNLRQDYASRLCSRSSWREGVTPMSSHRAPEVLGHGSPTESTSHGLPILKKGSSKNELVDHIMRNHWQLKSTEEDDVLGEVDIRLQNIHFDLISNHRKLDQELWALEDQSFTN